MKLPTEDSERQKILPWTFFSEYFPNAQIAKAKHSYDSNLKHAGEEGMKWAKTKSIGSFDRIMRHMIDFQDAYDSGDYDKASKELCSVAWRADEILERFLTNMEPFDTPSDVHEADARMDIDNLANPFEEWLCGKRLSLKNGRICDNHGPLLEHDEESVRREYAEYVKSVSQKGLI